MSLVGRIVFLCWLAGSAQAQTGWERATVRVSSMAICAGEPLHYEIVLTNTGAQSFAVDRPDMAGQHVAWALTSNAGEDSYDLAAMPDHIAFAAAKELLAAGASWKIRRKIDSHLLTMPGEADLTVWATPGAEPVRFNVTVLPPCEKQIQARCEELLALARREKWDEARSVFEFTSPAAVPFMVELFRAHGKHFDREGVYLALARVPGRRAAEGMLEIFASFGRRASLWDYYVLLLEHAAKRVGDRDLTERVRRAVADADAR